jgi:hypothetical protein
LDDEDNNDVFSEAKLAKLFQDGGNSECIQLERVLDFVLNKIQSRTIICI